MPFLIPLEALYPYPTMLILLSRLILAMTQHTLDDPMSKAAMVVSRLKECVTVLLPCLELSFAFGFIIKLNRRLTARLAEFHHYFMR